MEEIRELIKIVTSHTKKRLPLIDLKAQEAQDNKELSLFLGIKSGEYDSDVSASKGIYGEEEVDFKFRMLKSRLNRKLLNHLFFVDFSLSKAHKSVSFHQECMDYLHFSKMLLKLGEVKSATKLLYKTVDLARECEYYDILRECLLMLRDVYSCTYRPKLFRSTQEELEENRKILAKEEQASELFFESKLQLNSSLTNRRKDLSPLHEACERIKKLYDETGSVNIFIQYVKLNIWLFEQEGHFPELLKFVDLLETDFRKGKINQSRFDVSLLKVSKLYAHLKTGNHSEGLALAKAYLKDTDKESSIWYPMMENSILFSIRLKNYDEAAKLAQEVLNSKTFDELDANAREKWMAYAGYIYYLSGEKTLAKKLDFNTLTTEIPEFNKDKAGMNFAILVLQLLTHLDDDLDKLHQILSAMEDYVGKFLNNSFSKRAKVFFKLVAKIVGHNRDFDAIMKKSKYLAEKLYESDIEGDVYADLEIVPYELLWDHLLQRLSVLRFRSL